MFRRINRGIQIGLTIIGTTIGAGFASGRELWEFFASYGIQSINGVIIAMIIFALSSMFVLWISYKFKTENYYEVLVILMGKSLAKVFDIFIFLYLFSGSIVMFAGSGAAFEQWNFPYVLGIIVLAIAVWVVLIKGVNGLMSLNSILIPILIAVLLYVTISYNANHHLLAGNYIRVHLKVWPSAITYSALNVISLLGVLSTMGKKVESKSEMIIGGILSAIVLGSIALMLNFSLLKIKFAQQYEIPLFSLIPIEKQGLLFLVTVILWFAIYTTVLSNVHGLVYRIHERIDLSPKLISLFIIIIIFPLSFIGFSTLVNVLYPIYGVLNLYVLAVLMLYPFQASIKT